MPAGQPPIFKTAQEMQDKADSFIKECKEKGVKLTISGIAYELGFESRQSLYDYEEKDEFSYTVKRLKLFVESGYEQNLHGNSPTGSIFALKNMGWKDKVETGLTDKNGEDRDGVVIFRIPDNGRDNRTTGGLPDESTNQPG